jgi:hypothetical protein
MSITQKPISTAAGYIHFCWYSAGLERIAIRLESLSKRPLSLID